MIYILKCKSISTLLFCGVFWSLIWWSSCKMTVVSFDCILFLFFLLFYVVETCSGVNG